MLLNELLVKNNKVWILIFVLIFFLLDGVNRGTLRMQALSLTFSSPEKKMLPVFRFRSKDPWKDLVYNEHLRSILTVINNFCKLLYSLQIFEVLY
jgi:hypothetical protein